MQEPNPNECVCLPQDCNSAYIEAARAKEAQDTDKGECEGEATLDTQ